MPRNGPKRSPEGQQSILDAARTLTARHGPSRVSINQIAQEAGVGKQTIYRWWPSKAAVMLDALEQWCEEENPPPDTGSTRQDIAQQMERVAAIFSSPVGATIRELIAESQGDDAVAGEFRTRFFDVRQDRAMAVIQRGVDSGELHPDLDVGAATDMLYGPLWLRLLIGHHPLTATHTSNILETAWPALTADHAQDRSA